jgi:hypothetical protein
MDHPDACLSEEIAKWAKPCRLLQALLQVKRLVRFRCDVPRPLVPCGQG